VRVESNWRKLTKEGAEQVKHRRWRVYVDGHQLRRDEINADDSSREVVAEESVAQDGDVIRVYRRSALPDGARLIVGAYSADSPTGRQYHLSDPRIIGLNTATFSNLSQYTASSLISGRSEMRDMSIEDDQLEGQPCRVLVYAYEFGVAKIWIRPDRDFNIVRITKDYDGQRTQLDCELAEVPNYGWFPSRIVYQQNNENSYSVRETLQIECRDVNQPVGPAVFSFAGMGVPAGREIYDFTGENFVKQVMTKSGPVVTQANTQNQIQPIQPPARSSAVWILVINGVVLAALALWLMLGRRNKPA
jgi:hypothetical protein